jgi:hypothetical protein
VYGGGAAEIACAIAVSEEANKVIFFFRSVNNPSQKSNDIM